MNCCFIDGNISCGKVAEWEFYHGEKREDNYLHACTDHIGVLLDPNETNYVYSIADPEMSKT